MAFVVRWSVTRKLRAQAMKKELSAHRARASRMHDEARERNQRLNRIMAVLSDYGLDSRESVALVVSFMATEYGVRSVESLAAQLEWMKSNGQFVDER
jgi:hypothetical protein